MTHIEKEPKKHSLQRAWYMWSHPVDSYDWSLESYKKHSIRIDTVETFWEIYNDIGTINDKDMWFLMADGVPPIWEHEINRKGGSFKFRIRGSDAENTWLTLSMHLVSEMMCKSADHAMGICGIGISPKKNGFCTISVWNLDSTQTDCAVFPSNIPGIDFHMSMYQPNSDRRLG